MIEIRGVTVSFGGVRALNNVSLKLADPIVGIIGPNGAGKTTLLNVFSGFVDPDSGSIRAFGTDLLALPPHQRARWGLRRSFQTEQVVDDLSVADNVRVMLDALPRASRNERGAHREALDLSARRQGRWIGASLILQRRMVELAKTLVGSPKSSCSTSPERVCARTRLTPCGL
jgi:ABC-type branched-subunit amino acid transport system ATPase component